MGHQCAFVIPNYLLQQCLKLHQHDQDKKISVSVSSATNSGHSIQVTFEAIDKEQIQVEILEKESQFLLPKNSNATLQFPLSSPKQSPSCKHNQGVRRSPRRSTNYSKTYSNYGAVRKKENGKIIHMVEHLNSNRENFAKKLKSIPQQENDSSQENAEEANGEMDPDFDSCRETSFDKKISKVQNIKLEVVDNFMGNTDNKSYAIDSSSTISDEDESVESSFKNESMSDQASNRIIEEAGDSHQYSNDKNSNLRELDENGQNSIERESVCLNDNLKEETTVKQGIIKSEKHSFRNDFYSMSDIDEIEISQDLKTKKDKNGRFSCFLCSKKVLNLFTHISFMHKDSPDYVTIIKKLKKIFRQNSCNFCHLVFNNREKLNKHHEVAHRKGKSYVGFKCDICSAVLRNSNTFRLHLNRHSENAENRFKCNKCDLTFHSEQLLSRHEVHECGITFSCSFCEFKTTANKFLLKHIEINHTSGYHQITDCEICPKKLKNIHCLYRHVLSNHQNSPKFVEEIERLKLLQTVKCPHCSVTIHSKNLKRHIMAVHTKQEDQAIIKCQKCGIILKNIETLRSHIKNVHEITGRNFTCLTCKTSFRTSSNLRYHMKNVHADPTVTLKCQECNYTTSSKKYLKNHYSQTHVSANYMCGDCGRTFKTPDKLRRHNMLIHNPHEIEQHICEVCNKSFNVKANLTKHMKTVHLKQYAYTCNICGMGFQTLNLMKQHFKKKHSDSPLPDFTDPSIKTPINISYKPNNLFPSQKLDPSSNSLHVETTVLKDNCEDLQLVSDNITQSMESMNMINNVEIGDEEVSSSSLNAENIKIIEYVNYDEATEGQSLPSVVQNMFVEDQEIMYQEQEVTTVPMVYECS